MSATQPTGANPSSSPVPSAGTNNKAAAPGVTAAVTAIKSAAAQVTNNVSLPSPARTIPLILGLASLSALFIGFGMQYFLIGSGRSAQKMIDPLMEKSATTIASIAVIAVIGISIYYVLQTIENRYFWLFMLVMLQFIFLHIALSASLYQVEIVSK